MEHRCVCVVWWGGAGHHLPCYCPCFCSCCLFPCPPLLLPLLLLLLPVPLPWLKEPPSSARCVYTLCHLSPPAPLLPLHTVPSLPSE